MHRSTFMSRIDRRLQCTAQNYVRVKLVCRNGLASNGLNFFGIFVNFSCVGSNTDKDTNSMTISQA
jgi:hypothetical protein